MLGAFFGAILFGAIHLIAWDFEFPTQVERLSLANCMCIDDSVAHLYIVDDEVRHGDSAYSVWMEPHVDQETGCLPDGSADDDSCSREGLHLRRGFASINVHAS